MEYTIECPECGRHQTVSDVDGDGAPVTRVYCDVCDAEIVLDDIADTYYSLALPPR